MTGSRTPVAPHPNPSQQPSRGADRARYLLAGTVMVLGLALIGSGYSYYRFDLRALKQDKYNEVRAVADLKAREVEHWRQERLTDGGRNVSGSIGVATREWLEAPANDAVATAATTRLRSLLTAFAQAEGYEAFLVASPEGRILVSTDASAGALPPSTLGLVERAVATAEPVLGDFFLADGGRGSRLELAAPIPDHQGRPVAVLIQRVDPESCIYPQLRGWPLPSASAETLLIRRDGEQALFLNPIRHRTDAAMTMRVPLDRDGSAAVQALLGRTARFEGKDYRGVDVIADIQAIPGSPWFMVAKIDAQEIQAEAYSRAWMVALLVALALLLLGSSTGLLVATRRQRLYQLLYRAEQETRRSQEEISAILNSIGDGVIATGPTGEVDRMNPVAEWLTGWTEVEARGRQLGESFRIVNEDTRAPVENPAERALREGVTVGLANHTVLIAKDGAERPIDDSGAPIRDQAGNILGAVLVFRDISERRDAEENARGLAQRQQAILGAIPDIIMEVDENRVYTWTNSAGREFFGEDVIGKEAESFFEGEQETYAEVEPLFLGQPGTFYVESWQRRRDGERRLLAWWCRALEDAEGQVTGALSSARDITERHRAETAQLASGQRWRATFDAIYDRIYVLSEEFEFLEVNQAFCTSLGKTRDEILGKKANQLLHGASEPTAECPNRQAMDTGNPESKSWEEDGRFYDMAAWPLPSTPGEPRSFVHLVRDLTYEKRIADHLRQTQRMEAIGQLAGGVAHDFNNLLSSMTLQLNVMQMDGHLLTEELREGFEELLSGVRRGAGLTRQLLLFSRQQAMEAGQHDLNAIIADLEKMLRRIIGEQIEITLNRSTAPLWVEGDAGMLQQVLLNLCVNARDAMPQGGRLTIETGEETVEVAETDPSESSRPPGRFAFIRVSDTGHGIAANDLEHLFEPFFTTKEVGKGTGLGLSTVHGIVAQHRGWVDVQSQPGQGATFIVHLPLTERVAETSPRAPATTPMAANDLRILFVEDEPAVRRMAVKGLRKLGYGVEAAENAAEATRLWERDDGRFDLLMTDVVMPGGQSGIDLCRSLRALDPHLKIILASGYSQDLVKGDALGLDHAVFLRKPYDLQTLATIIASCVEAPEGSDPNADSGSGG